VAKDKPPLPLKKGSLVKVDLQAYLADPSLASSDQRPPTYMVHGPGEVLQLQDGAALIRWRPPVPDLWLSTTLLRPA